MGSIKRSPEIEKSARAIFVDMSKAEWAEAYRDLFAQVFGQDMEDAYHDADSIAWAHDAQRRAEILATYRNAEKSAAEAMRKQRANAAAVADGFAPPYPSEY